METPYLLTIDPYSGEVSASFDQVSDISTHILKAIQKETIGYGQLACALTVCRLHNPDMKLPDSKEAQFVSDLMAWTQAYFAIPVPKGLAN